MSVKVTHEGSTVQVTLPASANYRQREYTFKFECGQEWVAELLREAIQKSHRDALARVEQRGYDAGWREAKAKTKRRHNVGGYW